MASISDVMTPGTLGRQGSPKVLNHLKETVEEAGLEHIVVLLSEVLMAMHTA